mgnify:CR=1 FL=1
MPPVRILNPGSVPLAVLTEEELLILAQNLAAARIFSAAALESGKDVDFADPEDNPSASSAITSYWDSLSPIDRDAWLHVARQAYVTLAHFSGCDIDFVEPPTDN